MVGATLKALLTHIIDGQARHIPMITKVDDDIRLLVCCILTHPCQMIEAIAGLTLRVGNN
jgi:hypothetical protein